MHLLRSGVSGPLQRKVRLAPTCDVLDGPMEIESFELNSCPAQKSGQLSSDLAPLLTVVLRGVPFQVDISHLKGDAFSIGETEEVGSS